MSKRTITNTEGAHPRPRGGASRYLAVRHLRWGKGWLAPGDPVPDGEPGRDYAGLVARRMIRLVDPRPALRLRAKEGRR